MDKKQGRTLFLAMGKPKRRRMTNEKWLALGTLSDLYTSAVD
tara:strand:- start:18969 stop:19094 length:126 start_codon:yes stop_codon:yes gene_type:complete